MQGKICVSIGKASPELALAQVDAVAAKADVIEIRLDSLKKPVVTPFLSRINPALLFTCRASWEGGAFTGEEAARIALLDEAVAADCSYVDLELRSPAQSWRQLRHSARDSATRLICSWHDFTMTPSREDLLRIVTEMRRSGADIGKIVTMASSGSDALRVLALQERAAKMDFPLIAFCMGEAGIISRVATLPLGGYMTYCAPEKGDVTAPGQICIDDLQAAYAHLQL
ncbi:MAG TPA: type I 3-dehydroquinate dehydratase [Desulfopila sp.]|nr:type I 3-dehydroquinate dehydratase [Desulfopila sp.]